MPGMMDTVLNLGLNDVTVEGLAKSSGDERFAWDSYRRFIQMYSNVVLGRRTPSFRGNPGGLQGRQGLSSRHRPLRRTTGARSSSATRRRSSADRQAFPQDAQRAALGRIGAVFGSWMSQRAITYRRLNDIPGDWGTAVNVQAMVFGNMGETSATGVAFTRNPSTGENALYGEFLVNAQGEDVVAGIRTPQNISEVARIAASRKTVDGKRDAGDLRRVRPRHAIAGAPLPRHAGHGVHGRAWQVLDAADPQRQAHSQGRPAHRRGNGQ